jgi:SAM-dependent methyltransferase
MTQSSNRAWKYMLIPGRHHTLTRFQADWIKGCYRGYWKDNRGDPIFIDANTTFIFAVTSANHHTTRRNPISSQHRVSQIELFGKIEQLEVLVATLADVPMNDRFATHVIDMVRVDLEIDLTPDNTLVAVSTAVGDQYRALGYRTGGLELDVPGTLLAWDLVTEAEDDNWSLFASEAHPSSVDLWTRYGLVSKVRQIFNDNIVSGQDGSLTDTRLYGTYAQAFEESASRKWSQIREWVVPGRIVDVGCATGQLLVEAGKDERLSQSDLVGIESDRWLHSQAVHRAEQGDFGNPNTVFYRRNILNGDTFLPKSVDTTITAALTHEIYSYGERDADLDKITKAIARHTRSGGVWINLDVCGPSDGDQIVLLELSTEDGMDTPAIEDIQSLASEIASARLKASSSWSRLLQFKQDWSGLSKLPWSGVIIRKGIVRTTLKDAMEFMLHKDYTENWLSELHESFTYRDWETWVSEVNRAGFEVAPGSGTYLNEWIVANRFDNVGKLTTEDGHTLPWPATHMCLVAQQTR